MNEALNEEVEVNEVANKAAEIGKELGAVEDDAPDYDIVEEGDERIAKEKHAAPDKKDRPQLSNKEKREQRKKRLSEKFDEKDAKIEALTRQNQEFERKLQEFDGHITRYSQQEIETGINNTRQAFAQAEADYDTAFANGDAAGTRKATQSMYEAEQAFKQLNTYKEQAEKKPAAPQKPAMDPKIISAAKSWAARNDWYDPERKDKDSRVAHTISAALEVEGYDPRSDDFWDELDDRLSVVMPDRYEAEEDDQDDAPKPRKRAAPPVGGAAGRGDVKGKIKVALPTHYIAMLKREGIWDDKPRRDRIVKEYLENRKNAGA